MTIKHKNAKDVLMKILGVVSFGEMLYSLRRARELSQVELAELLSISKQDLSNIEKGRKLVSVDRAISFAHSLKMPAVIFAKYALQDQLTEAGIEGEVQIIKVV